MKETAGEKEKHSKKTLSGLACWHRSSAQKRRPGAPNGNTNALKHGIFANRVLDPDEQPLFECIVEALNKDFANNNSSDLISVELVGINMVRLARAYASGDLKSAEILDGMVRQHLRGLKALKISREAEKTKRSKGTPADWATALLEKIEATKIDPPQDKQS